MQRSLRAGKEKIERELNGQRPQWLNSACGLISSGQIVSGIYRKLLSTAFFVFLLEAHFLCHGASADNPLVSPRIIGGSSSSVKYSWMCSLFTTDANPGDSPGGHFCGAALVGRQFAVTAAHCVSAQRGFPGRVSLEAGLLSLSEQEGASRRRVAQIIVHPKYSSLGVSNDIALLKLEQPIDAQVLPVIGEKESSLWGPGQSATILGWGTTDPNIIDASDSLQRAEVPIRSDQECVARMGEPFNETMLCAGVLSSAPGVRDGIDGCYGDSGGPLFIYNQSGQGKLVGISSWGYACASHAYYGVYTKVAHYRRWIHSQLPAPRSRWVSGGCRGQRCYLSIRVRERMGGSPAATVAARAVFNGRRSCQNNSPRCSRHVRLKRTYRAVFNNRGTWRLRFTSPGFGIVALRINAEDLAGVKQPRPTRAILRPTKNVVTGASR